MVSTKDSRPTLFEQRRVVGTSHLPMSVTRSQHTSVDVVVDALSTLSQIFAFAMLNASDVRMSIMMTIPQHLTGLQWNVLEWPRLRKHHQNSMYGPSTWMRLCVRILPLHWKVCWLGLGLRFYVFTHIHKWISCDLGINRNVEYTSTFRHCSICRTQPNPWRINHKYRSICLKEGDTHTHARITWMDFERRRTWRNKWNMCTEIRF